MEEKEILKRLYDMAVERVKPSEEYKAKQDEVIKEEAELLKTIGEQHRETLDKLTCLQNEMYDIIDFDFFCAGFVMSRQLDKEIEDKKLRDI